VADDAAAILARLRDEAAAIVSGLAPSLDPRQAYAAGALHGCALKALAAVEAAMELHRVQERPVRSWDHVCPVHRDARGFADPRQRDMRDCPDCRFSEIYVCRHCGCPNDFWPCPTYRAILAALAGKEVPGA
jgi:hypothetical protein